MDRLSALDAEFLHIEDESAPMHIAGICVFTGPAPGLDELTAAIDAKLGTAPRYRQRVRTVPFELGRPIWVDDPGFRIERHVHHTALPAPGSDTELDALMGRLMAHPLDRERPLWESWLVDGLAGDRWALIFKVHHCMVDGIAGVHLLETILDMSPEPDEVVPVPWRPVPEPSAPVKVLGSWLGLVGDVVPWLQRLPRTLASPVDAARSAAADVAGLGRLFSHLWPTPPISLEGRIGPHRSWAHVTLDFDDVAVVRRRFGGTVNDVVLACVTAGMRALLLAHGDDPTTAVVRTAIPVSVRDDSQRHETGNRVSTLVAELPVALTDPVERLRTISEITTRSKASHMAEAGRAVIVMADLFPPMAVGSLSRLAIRAEHRLAQRSITTITTNVPGPPFPLYCLGREMLEYLPYLGLSGGIRVTTAILSYNGTISIGVTGDEDSVPDVAAAAGAAAAALADLRRAARRRAPKGSGSGERRRSTPS